MSQALPFSTTMQPTHSQPPHTHTILPGPLIAPSEVTGGTQAWRDLTRSKYVTSPSLAKVNVGTAVLYFVTVLFIFLWFRSFSSIFFIVSFTYSCPNSLPTQAVLCGPPSVVLSARSETQDLHNSTAGTFGTSRVPVPVSSVGLRDRFCLFVL